MNKGFLNIRNGVFCIIAMASSTFAAGPVLYINDLNNFQIDCNNKKQQIELLQSMRRSKSEIQFANLIGNWTTPGPIPSERTNWMVDYFITELRDKCYDEEFYIRGIIRK